MRDLVPISDFFSYPARRYSLLDWAYEMLDGVTRPAFQPAWRVTDSGDALNLEVELGLGENPSLEAFFQDGRITVQARAEDGSRHYRKSFTAPDWADPEAIQASYANGRLTIKMLRPEHLRPKVIPIQVAKDVSAAAKEEDSGKREEVSKETQEVAT